MKPEQGQPLESRGSAPPPPTRVRWEMEREARNSTELGRGLPGRVRFLEDPQTQGSGPGSPQPQRQRVTRLEVHCASQSLGGAGRPRAGGWASGLRGGVTLAGPASGPGVGQDRLVWP